MEEINILSIQKKVKRNPTYMKIINLVENRRKTKQKDFTIKELSKDLGIAYSYCWDIVQDLKNIQMLSTYKSKNEKGQPVRVNNNLGFSLDIIQEQIKKHVIKSLRSNKSIKINDPKLYKEDNKIDQIVHTELYKSLCLRFLQHPKIWDKYDIILKPRP